MTNYQEKLRLNLANTAMDEQSQSRYLMLGKSFIVIVLALTIVVLGGDALLDKISSGFAIGAILCALYAIFPRTDYRPAYTKFDECTDVEATQRCIEEVNECIELNDKNLMQMYHSYRLAAVACTVSVVLMAIGTVL